MTELMWVRSHVQQLLQELWGACRVQTDFDGDVAFRRGTAACWVSVLPTDPVMVRVFAHAVHGVRGTAALLRELNSYQNQSLSARVEFCNGLVLVSQTLSPIGMSETVLGQAVAEVADLANELGGVLATVYGGATPFEAELVSAEDGE